MYLSIKKSPHLIAQMRGSVLLEMIPTARGDQDHCPRVSSCVLLFYNRHLIPPIPKHIGVWFDPLLRRPIIHTHYKPESEEERGIFLLEPWKSQGFVCFADNYIYFFHASPLHPV